MASEVFFVPASSQEQSKVLAQKTEKVYMALGLNQLIDRKSFVALKIHFGEKGNTGFIQPQWLTALMKQIKKRTARAFFTDTNTLYVGNRSNAIEHTRLAWGHGFSLQNLGIPVFIADGLIGRDGKEIQVDLPRIKTAKIAKTFLHTDVFLSLAHFTGHMLTGFGAALKNTGMGCASRAGKLEQHSDVQPWVKPESCVFCKTCFAYCPTDAILEKNHKAFISTAKCIGCGECLVVCPEGAVCMSWDEDKLRVQEKMTEYAFSVHKLFGEKAGYINFLTRITKDCDCMSKDEPSIIEDVGIIASKDPVAVDKASVDLVNQQAGKDILRFYHKLDWSIQFNHAEKLGLGSTHYKLVDLS